MISVPDGVGIRNLPKLDEYSPTSKVPVTSPSDELVLGVRISQSGMQFMIYV